MGRMSYLGTETDRIWDESQYALLKSVTKACIREILFAGIDSLHAVSVPSYKPVKNN